MGATGKGRTRSRHPYYRSNASDDRWEHAGYSTREGAPLAFGTDPFREGESPPDCIRVAACLLGRERYSLGATAHCLRLHQLDPIGGDTCTR